MKFAQSLFRSVAGGAWCRLSLSAFGVLVILMLAGCDAQSRVDLPETDEPQYRRGQQYLRSQQNQHALEAFLKVIDRRDGDAPESHFEAGRIYLTHLGDPYAAIYHFRRYLQVKPNSQQAPMVEQMVQTAMKESLKGLPGSAMSAEVDRLDLLDMIKKLKEENDVLRARLAGAGVAVATPPTLPPTQNPDAAQARTPPQQTRPAAPPQQAVQQLDAIPVEEIPLKPAVLVETAPQAPVPPAVRQTPQRPAAGAATGRTYVVQPGDTLMAISQKIYGTRSRWSEIYDLNRDRMKHDKDRLKIGMELRLP